MIAKKLFLVMTAACGLLLGSGCSTVLTHTPSEDLSPVSSQSQLKLAVADIGDARPEAPNSIGFGFSYWLPQAFWSKDASEQPLPVAHFIADSLNQDLNVIGYQSVLLNKSYGPMQTKDALVKAQQQNADYLITSKVTHGKCNFWGYLIIPFFEPVKTRIGVETCIIDMNAPDTGKKLNTFKKKTEWRFAKLTLFDAVFDAAIFGRRWHRKAWGETVVPDALAEAVNNISAELTPQPVQKAVAATEPTEM